MTKKEREKCVIISTKKKRILKKKRITKEKKAKLDNFDVSEKEQLRKYEKEGRKVMGDNLDDNEKEQMKKEDNKRKKSMATWVIMKNNS